MSARAPFIRTLIVLIAALALGLCLGASPASAHHGSGHHHSGHHGLPVTSACCVAAALPARTSVPMIVAVLPVVWPAPADLAFDGRTPNPEPPPPKPVL